MTDVSCGAPPGPDGQQELFDSQRYLDPAIDPRHPCGDCGAETTTGAGDRYFSRRARAGSFDGTWEWYMVRDKVWAEAGMHEGFLCIGCLERRLGRHLRPADFADLELNEPSALCTERLRSRLGRTGDKKRNR